MIKKVLLAVSLLLSAASVYAAKPTGIADMVGWHVGFTLYGTGAQNSCPVASFPFTSQVIEKDGSYYISDFWGTGKDVELKINGSAQEVYLQSNSMGQVSLTGTGITIRVAKKTTSSDGKTFTYEYNNRQGVPMLFNFTNVGNWDGNHYEYVSRDLKSSPMIITMDGNTFAVDGWMVYFYKPVTKLTSESGETFGAKLNMQGVLYGYAGMPLFCTPKPTATGLIMQGMQYHGPNNPAIEPQVIRASVEQKVVSESSQKCVYEKLDNPATESYSISGSEAIGETAKINYEFYNVSKSGTNPWLTSNLKTYNCRVTIPEMAIYNTDTKEVESTIEPEWFDFTSQNQKTVYVQGTLTKEAFGIDETNGLYVKLSLKPGADSYLVDEYVLYVQPSNEQMSTSKYSNAWNSAVSPAAGAIELTSAYDFQMPGAATQADGNITFEKLLPGVDTSNNYYNFFVGYKLKGDYNPSHDVVYGSVLPINKRDTTTGVEDIVTDDDNNGPSQIFDLYGRPVDETVKGGIYIVDGKLVRM